MQMTGKANLFHASSSLCSYIQQCRSAGALRKGCGKLGLNPRPRDSELALLTNTFGTSWSKFEQGLKKCLKGYPSVLTSGAKIN